MLDIIGSRVNAWRNRPAPAAPPAAPVQAQAYAGDSYVPSGGAAIPPFLNNWGPQQPAYPTPAPAPVQPYYPQPQAYTPPVQPYYPQPQVYNPPVQPYAPQPQPYYPPVQPYAPQPYAPVDVQPVLPPVQPVIPPDPSQPGSAVATVVSSIVGLIENHQQTQALEQMQRDWQRQQQQAYGPGFMPGGYRPNCPPHQPWNQQPHQPWNQQPHQPWHQQGHR